jgi:hypothetical protein
MAYELIRPGHQLSIPAGSPINPRQPVKFAGTSALMVQPAATNADRPIGMNGAATAGVLLVPSQVASPGDFTTIYEESNIVKAIACASLGAGAEVSVGTTTGRMTPAALISASGHWAVGVALTPAGDGDVFALYVKPRKA